MKKIFSLVAIVLCVLSASAQQKLEAGVETEVLTPEMLRERTRAYNIETMLDSLDQDLLPRKVTGGVLLNGNVSNFIITNAGGTMSSYLRAGLEVGGFLDFYITKHMAILVAPALTMQQNHFSAYNIENNKLISLGMDVPVYFMGRFGNMQKGYIQFGGGLFTHFVFADNLGKKMTYSPDGHVDLDEEAKRYEYEQKYMDLLKLHNNHFGVCAIVGYEFPIGIQINASYRVSLSDIATYYSENKDTDLAKARLYPQNISLGLAYRFRHTRKQKTPDWLIKAYEKNYQNE